MLDNVNSIHLTCVISSSASDVPDWRGGGPERPRSSGRTYWMQRQTRGSIQLEDSPKLDIQESEGKLCGSLEYAYFTSSSILVGSAFLGTCGFTYLN